MLRSGAIHVEMQHFTSMDKPSPLVVFEPSKVEGCPFKEAKRVYTIVNTGFVEEKRGGHYHPKGGKEEILVCLMGIVRFNLISPTGSDRITLSRPWDALVIPTGVWHEMIVHPNSVLLSIASTTFDPNESINELPLGIPSFRDDAPDL